MCLTPYTLYNKRRDITDEHTTVVPCGKCPECLATRQKAWAFRLYQEMKRSSSAAFLTFTYAETPLTFNGHPTLQKKDFQNFMKRLRKSTKQPLKYYACGEYGELTDRPHYHAIMFNLPKRHTLEPQYLEKDWQHGHVHTAVCNMATIYYTTKYVMKGVWLPTADDDDRNPHFALMSKKMGLNYLSPNVIDYHQNSLKGYITLAGGTKSPMPKYFKEKLFTKQERRKIADKIKIELLPKLDDAFDNETHRIEHIKNKFDQAKKDLVTTRNTL